MMRVLIVEDELDLQAGLAALFNSIDPDIIVETASEITDTIAFMESQRLNPHFGYDLILADISLEGKLTGFDLWKVCSRLYPETHFVFMSGISAEEFLKRVKNESRCPPFLSKPFTATEVRALIKDVLDKKTQFMQD